MYWVGPHLTKKTQKNAVFRFTDGKCKSTTSVLKEVRMSHICYSLY